MSKRGRVLHVRGMGAGWAEEFLPRCGGPCAILASHGCMPVVPGEDSGRSGWTSFVPLDEASFDEAGAATSLLAPILQVWFDEDCAIVFQFFDFGWRAEFSVSMDGSYELGPQDEALFKKLVDCGLLCWQDARELVQKLRLSQGLREDWVRAHGIEQLFRLPFVKPMPVPCTEEYTRHAVPEAKLVGQSRREAAKPTQVTARGAVSAAARSWTTPERVTVDLHIYYLTQIWNLNNWKLYYRYKRHLPPERRHEVDRWVDLMTKAPLEELRQALEMILAGIWEADDWDAAIRDPEILKHEPLDQWQLEDWQRRLDETIPPRSDHSKCT
jgi:hypothetical protein